MTEPIIRFDGVCKSFGSLEVLKDLSLTVQPQERVALIGPSGSGKTTILRILMTLENIQGGTVQVEGKQLWHEEKNGSLQPAGESHLRQMRRSIGMVFQFGALFDSMTVGENISLALQKLTKLNENEIQQRVCNSLDEVDMAGTENLMPAELSGGMKKRVGIARAIAIKPAYLFYDEPTTGLDPVMTDSINRLIRKFQDTGEVTSVIITHEMRTVYDVADRVLLLHEGRIQYDGSPDTINNVDDPVVQQFITGNSTLV